jgi:hypothetical protein
LARRRAGIAAVTSVLPASGALVAGAAFGARDVVAAPATPYASGTWSRLSLDGSVYGSPVNGTLRTIEASGDDADPWNGLPSSPSATSATSTGSVDTTTGPETGMTSAAGAYTDLAVPDSTVPWVAQLVGQGTPSGDDHAILQVPTWNDRVQCAPPANVIAQNSTIAPCSWGGRSTPRRPAHRRCRHRAAGRRP